MTDFLADLEAELLAAARRRAAHRRLPRPRAAVVLRVAAAVAVLAVLAAVVTLVAGPRAGSDHSAVPPAGTDRSFGSVAGGQLARPCTAGARVLPATRPPADLLAAFAELRRSQREPDALPTPPGSDPGDVSRWLPVATYDPRSVRRLGAGDAVGRPVHVVPTTELRTGPLACGPGGTLGPGVCLVAGDSGGPLTYDCFAAAAAKAGQAVMGADRTGAGARLAGLMPDGVRIVTVTQDAHRWELAVTGNLIQRYLPLRPRGIRLTLHRDAPGCATTVDARLPAAIAALRRPAQGAPPESLASALEGGRIAPEAARIAAGGDGVTWWVVPASFATDTPCAPLGRACVIPVTAKPAGAPACARAQDAQYGGGVIAGPLDGQVAVYGVVAPRVAAVRVTIDGQAGTVDVFDGVAAGLLILPWHNGSGVGFTYVAAPDAPVVAVLNGTRVDQLATRVLGRIERQAFRPGAIGTNDSQAVARSRVLYAPGHRGDAEAVRRMLRTHELAPLDAHTRGLLGAGRPDVVVVAGADLVRRFGR